MKYRGLLTTILVSTSLLGSVQGLAATSSTSTNESSTSTTQKLKNAEKIDSSKGQEKQANEEKSETVYYNGKMMDLPLGPSKVAPEKEITSHSQGTMGELARQSNKARESTDVFAIGDKSKPDVDFIDVSSYQYGMTPQTFDYMRSKGLKGVVVKLTEGTNYRNPEARQQIESAKKAGIKVSTYHFSHFQNKAQAEAEADAYAKYALELGLPKSTVMVNDIESSECNNGYATSNSIWFAKRLIDKWGFDTVIHYSSQSWFDSGVLNRNQLGKDSVWIASYPYHPSCNDLWFKGYAEAWQFSSTMTVPGYTNSSRPYIDANIDYTGRFTQSVSPAQELSQFYVTVDSKGHNIYGDTALSSVKQSTSDVYHHTFQAQRYYVINGKKYYSIYDDKGQWNGYISEDDVKTADTPGGAWFGQSHQYATVISDGYPFWNNFNFSSQRGIAKKGQLYEVKGLYYHINGCTYASVYDNRDNWIGYINVNALDIHGHQFGEYNSFNKYVTVMKSGYGIYQNRNLTDRVAMSNDKMHQTFEAKGYYDLFDGKRFYSLYDDEGNWVGYIQSEAVKIGVENGENPGGVWFGLDNQYGVVTKDDYPLWSNFNFSSKNSIAKKGEIFEVRGVYHHVNGCTYATCFDKDDNWLGYINTNALNIQGHQFGEYHDFDKYVTIMNGGYYIYKDRYLGEKMGTSDEKMHQTFKAKGYYDLFNGQRFYTLYDGNDQWAGYIQSEAIKIGVEDGKNPGGVWFGLDNQYGVVTRDDYPFWSDFEFSSQNSIAKKGESFEVRGVYHHVNGCTYATCFDKEGNWLGYMNTNALKIDHHNPW